MLTLPLKQTIQFISFNFSDIQLLEKLKILAGAARVDSFLKAYSTSETKGFFPYEWFDYPDKIQKIQVPPYDAFCSKLRNCNPLEAEYTYNVNLLEVD